MGFALEQAAWPALVVDAHGAVVHANRAARQRFGAAWHNRPPSLAALWAEENPAPPEKFFSQWVQSASPTVTLRLKLPGDLLVSHAALVCAWPAAEAKLFLLQLPGEGPAGADAGLALKQKLDCALQLARTVALDFNNALTSILGHVSLVLSKMEVGHPWRASLLEVEKSAARAAEIANDLGTFSRQEREPRAQAAGNLNQLLQRTVEFVRQNTLGQDITWSLLWERRLYTARFDEAKMQQAFLKILENAVQALSQRGRITVQTRNLELTEPTQDRNVRLPAGAYVCAEISDSGCGIEADVLPRIFEPFFTTKKHQGHRGLGLAWVYGIVTNHGGGVAVSSQPGMGTSVRVYLPATPKVVPDAALTATDLSGDQTILIVDDEPLLLTMGQTVLSAYGYHVLTANSGAKALQILRQTHPPVDLVITDMVMPQMSGRELVEHIRQIAPATRIVCTSGYVRPASEAEAEYYLQKPFTSQELLLKVKRALGAPQAPGAP